MGMTPIGGLIFDGSGNLYGTTVMNDFGEGNGGVVYELTPSNGTWTITNCAGTGGGMVRTGASSQLGNGRGG